MSLSAELRRLSEVIEKLHGPGGCPWDRSRTPSSLAGCLEEEVAEYLEALAAGEAGNIREELGDVLLVVLFSAKAAEREGLFRLEEVIGGLADKLVRRHPHVFGDGEPAATPGEALARWRKAKSEERKGPDKRAARDGG